MVRFPVRLAVPLGCLLLGGCPRRFVRPAAPRPASLETREQTQRRLERERRRLAAETKRLYEAGVDAYARGDMGEAERFFTEVLQLDRDHFPAQKALRRLAQREIQER